MDLKKLRELAEKATPGPWKHDDAGSGSILWAVNGRRDLAFDLEADDASYIAAMNPQTALALLDVIDAAAEVCETIGLGSLNGLDAALTKLLKKMED